MPFEIDEVWLSAPIIHPQQATTVQYFKDNVPDIPDGLLEQIILNNKLLFELIRLFKGGSNGRPIEAIKKKLECPRIEIVDYTSPSFIRRDFPKFICKPIEKKVIVKPILYPVEKGYFQILGIPGGFKVIGKKIVDKVGEDLKSKLPIYFNFKTREGIELVSISKYRIEFNGDVLLTYESYNHNTDVRRIFEAGPSIWFRYAR